MRLGSKLSRGAGVAAVVSLIATIALRGAAADRTVPLTCTRGSEGQSYRVIVTMPASQPIGSTFTIRIAAARVGPIEHFGLRYVYNMAARFTIPAGTTYVEGSARFVPGTGSANVRASARVTHDAHGIYMLLPGHVENGGTYTAPTIEYQVVAVGPAGTVASLGFMGTSVDASAAVIGDVHTACRPSPRPYTIGTTRIVAATPPPSVDAR